LTAPALLDPGDPLPFEDLLLPIVRDASRRLAGDPGAAECPLDATARERLGRELLEILSAVSARTFYREFQAGRDYAAFVARMREGELARFLRRHPVLGRLIEALVDRWVETSAELLTRLEADRSEIERVFGAGAPLGPVAALDPGLSDRHGGRAVAGVTFASGVRVVYKPRDLGPESAFFEFARWVDERAPAPALRYPRIVPRWGYGWMEHVPHRPLADARDAGLYYRAAGKLLCLLHLLGATDCHAGNVIASGEHPVPVDLETLLQPPSTAVGHGLLLVGILPFWKRGLDGKSYDVGALTGSTGREQGFRAWRCRAINTDAMELEVGYETIPTGTNVLLRDGAPVRAGDHVEDVVAGFTDTWRRLASRRDELVTADGPLARFADLRVRVLARPTLVYARAIHESLDPELLRDPAAHEAGIERRLREHEATTPEGVSREELVRAEREALARMDVPLFHAKPRSGYRAAIERTNGLDEAGLEEATGLIRTTLGLTRLAALL
jgi:type 2 lantibiotic biosynthesis protein LanM